MLRCQPSASILRTTTEIVGFVKDWEIIADNLSKAGWSWGCVSAIDSKGERSGLQTHIATTEGLPVLSLWRDSRSRIPAGTSSAFSVRRRESQAMMPRFCRYLPGPRPTWRCLKSDLRSWGELWDIPPPLGSFAGLRSPTFDHFFGSLFLVLHACYFS